MLRSIVSRSHPLLSQLRWPAAAPVGAKPRILPPRAYASSVTPAAARCNGSADGTTPAAARHLYVVLQERAMERFIIYKLPDVDKDTDDHAPLGLPRAALCLSETLVGPEPQFEALGSKIVIYGYNCVISDIPCTGQLLTLLYDTKTGMLGAGGALRGPDDVVWIKHGYHAATPIGADTLCVLEAALNKPYYLRPHNNHVNDWSWEMGPSPLPLDATDYDIDVTSHAVHPDGYTIFASSDFTFCLDTRDNNSAWRGDWILPFDGRAYYDDDLDAWVGIRLANGKEGGSIKGYPYLCLCDIPTVHPRSRRSKRGQKFAKPAWKMCKEELTFVEASARARSPTLVHTGRGRFCLVEISRRGEARVTMFFLKRDKNGEVEVTPCFPGRSYAVPNYSSGLYTALWM